MNRQNKPSKRSKEFVYIKWVDPAHSDIGRWKDKEEMVKSLIEASTEELETVGMKIFEDDERIILTLAWHDYGEDSEYEDDVLGCQCVLKKNIIERIKLNPDLLTNLDQNKDE